ncbi:MAG: phosphatase PAP2 family protein, partial [Bacteroidales bacterium]|nr:phosphatase PAP2 family protein [Bacteroidales bacterium]
ILDRVMLFFTASLPWIPLYIILLIWIVYRFGYKGGNYPYSLAVVVAAVITFAITDMGSSYIKELTERLRPGHDPNLEGLIRLLDGKGGLYGFVSSHAANVFGLATFTSLVMGSKKYRVSIFIWASIVSYSRIYVGRHFPLDVIFGALTGMAAGYMIYAALQFKFIKKITGRTT